jgi:hypothetical protein
MQSGGRGMKQPPPLPPTPRHIFKKFVNQNAIKPKIGYRRDNFVLKALTPRDFSKNLSYVPGFSTHVHRWCNFKTFSTRWYTPSPSWHFPCTPRLTAENKRDTSWPFETFETCLDAQPIHANDMEIRNSETSNSTYDHRCTQGGGGGGGGRNGGT